MQQRSIITRYLGLSALSKFGMTMTAATYATFLISRGLNLFEINLVNLVFWTTLFILELPTGAIADVYGRRISYIGSCLLVAVGCVFYGFGHTFLAFAIAEAIVAVGKTLANGAFQAWMIDALHERGADQEKIDWVLGQESRLGYLVGIGGGLLGAILARQNLAYPWFGIAIVFGLVAILATIVMHEATWDRPESLRHGTSKVGSFIKNGITLGLSRPPIRFVLATTFVLMLAVQAPNMQWQPWFGPHLPGKTESLGILFMIMSLCMAFGSGLVRWLLRVAPEDDRLAFVICYVVAGVGIMLGVASNLFIALPAFLVHELARGALPPLKTAYLSRHATPEDRATLLSFGSVPGHLGGMIGLLASGFIAQYVSIPAAWVLSGGALVIIVLFLWRKS